MGRRGGGGWEGVKERRGRRREKESEGRWWRKEKPVEGEGHQRGGGRGRSLDGTVCVGIVCCTSPVYTCMSMYMYMYSTLLH